MLLLQTRKPLGFQVNVKDTEHRHAETTTEVEIGHRKRRQKSPGLSVFFHVTQHREFATTAKH